MTPKKTTDKQTTKPFLDEHAALKKGRRTTDRLRVDMKRFVYTDWIDILSKLQEEADERRVPVAHVIRELTYAHVQKRMQERGEPIPKKRYTER